MLLALSLTACATPDRPDEGGFYSYVDASGQLVTVERPAGKSDEQIPDAASDAPEPKPVPEPEVAPGPVRSPTDLWLADEEDYLSEDQVRQLIKERERDRFITYTDEQGNLVTAPVDMLAAREAARERAENPGYEARQAPKVLDGWTEVSPDCCAAGMQAAEVLRVETEKSVSFTEEPHSVRLGGDRPAQTLKLGPGVKAVEVRTWLAREEYLHPQLVWLDEKGMPLMLIANPFDRKYSESWFSHAYLAGRVEAPPAARWLVIVIPYAEITQGRPAVENGAELPWQEPGYRPGLNGELVIRGLSE